MKYKLEKKYLYWGAAAFAVIVCSILFFWTVNRWDVLKSGIGVFMKILTPFILGFVFAYILNPVAKLLQEKVFRKTGAILFPKNEKKADSFNRSISIFLALTLVLLFVILLMALMVTQLVKNASKIETLLYSVSGYITQFSDWVERVLHNRPELEKYITGTLGNVYDYVQNWISDVLLPQTTQLIANVTSGVVGMISGLVNTLIGIVVSVYLLYSKKNYTAQIKKILFSVFKPAHAREIIRTAAYTNKVFSQYFFGRIVDSAIIGVLAFIGLILLRMPSATLMAIVIGVTNIIPFFGPFIGAIPCALLVLLDSPVKCLIFVIFIVVLQQFDGNILGPRITSNLVGLPGFWVLFAIIVGNGLFGFVGMICGVPVFTLLYAAVRKVCDSRLEKKRLPVETAAYGGEDIEIAADIEEE